MDQRLPITTIIQRPSTFAAGLYAEHLEEASFLYEQRGTLFHDPEITWLDIGDFENRFEAHIDALVVGGAAALYVCQQQMKEGDAGELHAAVRVFCRQKRIDLIRQALVHLDIDDNERVMAVRIALKQEWPEEWQDELSDMLCQIPEKCIAVMPAVAGFKRIPAEGALSFALPICPDCVLYPEVKSMGRLQVRSARTALFKLLKHKDVGVQGAAALSLLRMGVSLADAIPEGSERLEFWQLMHIALAGGPGYIPGLLRRLEGPGGEADQALVLGVLGDPRSVDGLLRYLDKQEEAGTVAIALNLITGAELYEEVFIPDPVDEDELFDEEIEKLKRGEPLYAAGEEPGISLVQLSQDPQKWRLWCQEHRSGFQPGVRYRNGVPYHPKCLLENLRSEKSPVLVRQIAYEELVVRYKLDVPFETDMTVMNQVRALEKLKSGIDANAAKYQAGVWYFTGQII